MAKDPTQAGTKRSSDDATTDAGGSATALDSPQQKGEAKKTSSGAPQGKAKSPQNGNGKGTAGGNAKQTSAKGGVAKKKGKGGKPGVEIHEIEEDQTWRASLIRSVESFSSSLVVHLLIIIALALTTMALDREPEINQVFEIEERPDEEINQVLEENLDPSEADSLVSAAGVPIAAAAEVSDAAPPSLDAEVMESSEGPQVALADVSVYSFGDGDNLSQALGQEVKGEPSAVVDNYDQAMDRITREILIKLDKGKVLVVWLFDQSNSMKDDQKEIRDRIDKVYAELGLRGVTDNPQLRTAVCSYGENYVNHTGKTPPHDVNKIREAIDDVPVDESGLENMCTAVGKSITEHTTYAKRGRYQPMLIIVSDESGEHEDNIQYLEAAIQVAKDNNTSIYCLGREAVFGYPYAHYRWVDPVTNLTFWRRINRGPETPMVEALQTNGLYRRWDAHNSGFGPYDQVRMCRETGGIFFMLPSLETNLVRGEKRRYELEAMRPYLPDLTSRAEYAQKRDSTEMGRRLFELIMLLNPYRDPKVSLRHTFSIDQAEFAKQATEAMQKAKTLVLIYDEAEKILEELRPARDQERSYRWQANYDLIYAQVISYKVRVYEYGAYLDDFMKNPKPILKPKTNHWDITTRAKTITGELTASYIERSNYLFQRIIEEHAGTPWAARAQWELNRGYGVELIEDYDDPRRSTVKVPNF